jgi:hypothetical protein
MAAPYTPEWWLEKLSAELVGRQERITLLRSYANGDGPLPEGAKGMRAAYREFQKKSRTNWGSLIVDAVLERMTPAGFRVADSEEMDKEANRIWQANQLDVFSRDVHEDMLTVGYGYVLVNGAEVQRSGFWAIIDKLFGARVEPIITREDPALMITAHDPLVPQRVVAALKMFHDDVSEKDFAYLYLPGKCYVAEKQSTRGASTDINSSGYQIVETRSLPAGFENVVPVVCFPNNNEQGEFEPHTDVIDTSPT